MNKASFRHGFAAAIYIMVFLTCTSCQKNKNPNAKPTVEHRDLDGIDPFAQAARVELVTYKNDRMAWWIDTYGTDWAVVENGMLTMPADSIRSIKELDATQMEKWQYALYVRHFCQDTSIGLCYQPRHLLLFYNPDNQIYAYIEICFSCGSAQFSEGVRKVVFCRERINYIYACTLVTEA